MSEDTFQFKKFSIVQNQYVHRVGTDGVLLGAWVGVQGTPKILDVGTGTGVIAIMMAQRSNENSHVVAIEPDPTAYKIAAKNINQSPFSKKVSALNSSLQDFKSQDQFDLIVCNPPFFTNSLKPPTEHRTKQRHTEDLNFDNILTAVTKLLYPTGRLALILPTEESKIFINHVQNFGLGLIRQCDVYPKIGKPMERCLMEFSYNSARLEKNSITIMTEAGDLTPEYKQLTNDFYLKF